MSLGLRLTESWAVIVAQLAELSLLTPEEVRGSSPVIGIFYIEHWITVNLY